MLRDSTRNCLALVATLLLGTTAVPARAAPNGYPTRPIRFIVPYPPGGSTDPLARHYAAWLSEKLGENVVVDNRPGAGATIGHALGAQADPDGYTILFATSGGLVTGPVWGTKISYDPIKSFSPVSLIADAPYVLAVNPAVPAKNVRQLIAYAKKRPGQVFLGSPGAGTPNHLGIELLKAMTGAPFSHVPYKGGGPAMVDLLSGRIQGLFGSLTYIAPQVSAGKVRVIAIGYTERIPQYPDVPTVAELLPGFNCSTWFAVLAPAGTPRAIVNKLNAEIRQAVADARFHKTVESMGLIAKSSTPETVLERIRRETARWTKVIRDAGIGLK
ncbi:MAG: tripartite tricarboxylate transporter substrate binding protein [Burkholderiales bacterium]|nr:tripartite tricarboxylate transporter substrate binding protein [Burkholderiales bacterium]